MKDATLTLDRHERRYLDEFVALLEEIRKPTNDEVRAFARVARYARNLRKMFGDGFGGTGMAMLWTPQGDLRQAVAFANLITQVGDQYYGERAAGISSPPNQVTGMRLGTGTTTPSKTGAGAAIVTYVSGSQKAIDATFPQSALSGSSRRITWRTTWIAGEATANAIAEVVITNETPITNVAGTAANTISRALLSPTVNKGATDTLEITWNHDLLGA